MSYQPVFDYFLGALSPSGFFGWFHYAAKEPTSPPFLLKAGPGCGKSTFMRRLAEASPGSGTLERLHCSSDPESLDGIRLSSPDFLILDATAPHIVNCTYPGVSERVVSLYDTLDYSVLKPCREEILALGRQHAKQMQQAAAHFALTCALLQRQRALTREIMDTAKTDALAARLAHRTMPARRNAKEGAVKHRLLSAPTPNGVTVFSETAKQAAPVAVYALCDAYGAVSGRRLEQLADHARNNGYDAVHCHCATDQRNKLDHLLLPSLGLAFITANPWHTLTVSTRHEIHTRRMLDGNELSKRQRLLTWQRRTADKALAQTCETLAAAKATHDKLERYFVDAMDFTKADTIRAKLEQEWFGG